MKKLTSEKLIVIPDFIIGFNDETMDFSGAHLVACADKLPASLRRDGLLDANDADCRVRAMLLVERVAELIILTPSFSFYRKLAEMRDECFFVNMALRLIALDAYVTIATGMRQSRIPAPLNENIEELNQWNIKMLFEAAPEQIAPDKELILAEDVIRAAKSGKTDIVAGKNAIVTPYAWDEAKERNITIRKRA